MGIKTQLDPMMTSANSREESSSRLYKERKDKGSSQRKKAMFSHHLKRKRKEKDLEWSWDQKMRGLAEQHLFLTQSIHLGEFWETIW